MTTRKPRPDPNAPATRPRPTIRVHLWLESLGQVAFGIGRVHLLTSIRQHGSLRRAALALGMSYRAAWGKLRRTEQTLGVSLLEGDGRHGVPLRLTREGEELADAFQNWYDAVERYAEASARELLPFEVARFQAPEP